MSKSQKQIQSRNDEVLGRNHLFESTVSQGGMQKEQAAKYKNMKFVSWPC